MKKILLISAGMVITASNSFSPPKRIPLVSYTNSNNTESPESIIKYLSENKSNADLNSRYESAAGDEIYGRIVATANFPGTKKEAQKDIIEDIIKGSGFLRDAYFVDRLRNEIINGQPRRQTYRKP